MIHLAAPPEDERRRPEVETIIPLPPVTRREPVVMDAAERAARGLSARGCLMLGETGATCCWPVGGEGSAVATAAGAGSTTDAAD